MFTGNPYNFPGRLLTHSAGGSGGEIIARKHKKKDSGLMNRVCCRDLDGLPLPSARAGPGLSALNAACRRCFFSGIADAVGDACSFRFSRRESASG